MDEDRLNEEFEALLSSEATDRIADYAGRGRKFEALDDEPLRKAWVLACLLFTRTPSDQKRSALESDLRSEIFLRGNDPPFELIRTQLEQAVLQQLERLERMGAVDPERLQKISDEAARNVQAFICKRDRSKN